VRIDTVPAGLNGDRYVQVTFEPLNLLGTGRDELGEAVALRRRLSLINPFHAEYTERESVHGELGGAWRGQDKTAGVGGHHGRSSEREGIGFALTLPAPFLQNGDFTTAWCDRFVTLWLSPRSSPADRSGRRQSSQTIPAAGMSLRAACRRPVR